MILHCFKMISKLSTCIQEMFIFGLDFIYGLDFMLGLDLGSPFPPLKGALLLVVERLVHSVVYKKNRFYILKRFLL